MGITYITGISDSRTAAIGAEIAEKNGRQCLIVAATESQASKIASDISFFAKRKVFLMPADEFEPLSYEARSRENVTERLKAMRALSADEECIVVTSAVTASRKLMPASIWKRSALSIVKGEETDLRKAITTLVDLGYERVPMVYAAGQFSVRGDILDVFTPYDEMPYRTEFFDNEVETVRMFDTSTQRSVGTAECFEIPPANALIRDHEAFERAAEVFGKIYKEMPEKRDLLIQDMSSMTNVQNLEPYMPDFYERPEHIWDYLTDGCVIVDDPNRIYELLSERDKAAAEDIEVLITRKKLTRDDIRLFTGLSDYLGVYNMEKVWLFSPMAGRVKGVKTLGGIEHINCRQVLSYNGKTDLLETDLKRYVNKGYKVTIACSSDERVSGISEFLSSTGLAGSVSVKRGTLSSGMDLPEDKICYISDADIFGRGRKRIKRKSFDDSAEPIRHFSEIKEGDFVVHDAHGIGRYAGIKRLNIRGESKDFMEVKYAGHDVLYVPAEQMSLIRKYIAPDSGNPKISRLSGNEWRKTKAKAKAAVAGMAEDLLKVSAERRRLKGYSFSPDTVWQKEFEESFPFIETGDQLRCTEEIKRDMESSNPMDRLLCGDVGYGKTEVAARAIFKCAADGKQAAVLVPTTILADQHYNTLKERFERFPFKMGVLSRFKSDSEIKQTLQGLKDGSVDIVIGTHRLLSGDAVFKDLGLLVIDEEQRFGVKHKEAIKKLRSNIDVLTLSATPIPRTLHMSLLGIRDMSVIAEPPEDRYPVQTYVMEEDDMAVAEAVERELDRGGQVFVVYNRISGIYRVAEKIKELVPSAEVCVGHGRMNEDMLENVMMSFVSGENNVLVATTIIENGIDIPNANTVIVLDADKYGLSQLYQIRGRVGRTNRTAYAYLLHKRDKVLSETAVKRLRAIKDFTEFGAGFKIAMRDLEIRGAGDILGREQSGHIVNVGYEMYCKLVDDAVRALRGEIVNDEKEDTLIDIRVSAYIPDSYVRDEASKLDVYRKIAEIRTAEDASEMREELTDVFGEIPKETDALIDIARIKAAAEELDIGKVSQSGRQMTLRYRRPAHTRPVNIMLDKGGEKLSQMIDILERLAENQQ